MRHTLNYIVYFKPPHPFPFSFVFSSHFCHVLIAKDCQRTLL